MSWTGLSEFADDTVTDYSRPSPTIESTSGDDQNKNPFVTKTEASPSTISPKLFIKFVKAAEKSTTNKVETVKKPSVKACYNCGHFDHLSYDCGLGVKMGRSSPKNNYTHRKSPKAREGVKSKNFSSQGEKLEDAVRTKRSRGVGDYILQVKKKVLTKKLDCRCSIKFRGGLLGIKCSKIFPLSVMNSHFQCILPLLVKKCSHC
uniref:CCHC-type domain-containing protein n=1 Tax=Tanacetum cinerariifolium TaxID=118510 RepID=A0A699KAR6_TANCI|nr:hypothetical protein [Tanacetum cinerariifolium]